MEHKTEMDKLEKEFSDYVEKARKISKKCSFWNDAGVLTALISQQLFARNKSPLRDNNIFPHMSAAFFDQMSRQSVFTAIALIAKYGEREEFDNWAAKSKSPLLPPTNFSFNFKRAKEACDIWVNIMRANLSLAHHRLLMKDKIYGRLFGKERETGIFGDSRVGLTTKKSVERFEQLKQVSPLTYRWEAPSQGTLVSLCNFYSKMAKGHKEKLELAQVLSFSYALFLLSKIHRSYNQAIASLMSLNAVVMNLCETHFGLPPPTEEETLLSINTDQPLFFRAYESVSKLLGIIPSPNETAMENKDVWNLLRKVIYNPLTDPEPLVSLTPKCVILQATSDGCVFFDDVGVMIPVLTTEQLLSTGKFKNLQGELFRQYIERITKRHGISPFRVKRVKDGNILIGDVDIGFVKNGYLCLVECKDITPYPSMALDKEQEILRSIQHKSKGYIGWIEKNFELQKYFSDPRNLLKLAAEKRFNPNQIKVILGVVVTNRPVFTYLNQNMLLTPSIPKIMIVDEYEMLLSNEWKNIIPEQTLIINDK